MKRYFLFLGFFLFLGMHGFCVSDLQRKSQIIKRRLSSNTGDLVQFLHEIITLGEVESSTELSSFIRYDTNVNDKGSLTSIIDEYSIPFLGGSEFVVASVIYDNVSANDEVLIKDENVFRMVQSAINYKS